VGLDRLIRVESASPLGPIDQASIEFKTIFDSLVEQGFTESHAIYLVAAQITGNPGIAPGPDLPLPPGMGLDGN
jgi:hypothetical protein